MQVAFFCCFRQGVAGMSRDLGRDVPDLAKLYARKLSSTARLWIWTLRIWGFRDPGFRSARHVLCGDASRLFLDPFSKHLNSVLDGQSSVTRSGIPGPKTPNHSQSKQPLGTVWNFGPNFLELDWKPFRYKRYFVSS